MQVDIQPRALLNNPLIVADAVLVQDASIIAGIRMLLDHGRLIVEPSAAIGVVAVIEDRERFAGDTQSRARQQR